jgi:16S rRNA processing protein RimM
MPKELIVVGRFGKKVGIRGLIKVQSFTIPPENILQYQPLFIEKNHAWQKIDLEKFEQQGANFVAKIKAINTPEEVSFFTNHLIATKRECLKKLSAGQYYHSDLIGLKVVNQSKETLGTVTEILATVSNDVLVTTDDEKREHLIPYLKHVIINIDLEEKIITVDWDKDF